MGLPAQLGWQFACPDWVERLREGRSLLPDLPLDQGEAERAVGIFNELRLPDVPGQPRLEDAGGEWGRDIVRALFGSLSAEGIRQVPGIFAMVPKKNAKTTNGAAIMMTAMLINKRPRAEYQLIGPTQEIADTAFQQAVGMIEADAFLKRRFHVAEHTKTITDRVNKARLKVKTFDMKVATGSKPVGVLIDELHLMGNISYAARVIGQLTGGMIANPESFLIIITTQSDEAPAGVFKSELDYARAVRDGRIEEPRMLPMLYEFPEAMQTADDKPWRDPKLWHMVLPNLGRSITIDRLVAEYRTARDKGEEEERRWASQHLNIQIGLALHTDRWRGVDYWAKATDFTLLGLDELIERSEVITGGFDGGGLDDLAGLALIGREIGTRRWLGWCRAWAQDDVFRTRLEIAPRLNDFVEAGDLIKCGDATEDMIGVADVLERVLEAGLFPETHAVGFDPAGVSAIMDELLTRGFAEEQITFVTQGFRLSPATWGLERKLKDGTFVHAPQALMDWCVSNAKAEQRGNAVLITKQAAGKAKIDPLIALFNAFMLMSRSPEASGGPSVYEDRGILEIEVDYL